MFKRYKTTIALAYSTIFHLISLMLIGLTISSFVESFLLKESEFIALIIESINNLVIGLAMFELGIGVGKEYLEIEEGDNIFQNMRRTITRFVGTVSIALVLEGLIMIIKYSKLELAGNLYYPVSILFVCSFLLIGLGVFLRLTGQSDLDKRKNATRPIVAD